MSRPSKGGGRDLTVGEFAKIIAVDRRSVYRWIKEGRIRAGRAGWNYRIRRSEVDRFLYGDSDVLVTEVTRPRRAAK